VNGSGVPPHRVAAIDIGSNAIRYVVAEVTDAGDYVQIEGERLAVRLGRDVFTRERRFTPATLDLAVEALGQIRRRLDDLGIANYRAVATSAVRESRNGGELIERVRRESGIHVETISGSEEARLVWLAVRHRVPLGPSRWFMMDLGGGSVELSVVDQEGILWNASHTLGSVRLLQAFEEDPPGELDGAAYRELLERYVHVLKAPEAVARWNPAGAIATGGNIEALADLASAPRSDGVSVLSLDSLRKVMERLDSLTMAERIEKLGLRADRADVIVPAAVVYERVAEIAGAREILIPRVGVKEGLLLDLIDETRNRVEHAGRREKELHAAAVTLGRRYRFDEPHALQVSRLALSLYDQTADLHGLGSRERGLLMVAALLHDIGQFVSYRRHHKHSMYLIAGSELPGLSPADLEIVALLARYHRRSEPRDTHPVYQDLDEADRSVVCRLAGILRVADALDREHLSRVASLNAIRSQGAMILELEVRGSVALEAWAIRKKGKLFETTFGLALRLDVTLPEAGNAS